MDLHDVAQAFDHDQLYDGYTGVELFKCQSASYDDSTSDGATIRRRIISHAPAFNIPTRRVVTLYGERWLVGAGVTDGYQGEPIRKQYTMKRADAALALLTPGQACTAAAGTLVYAQRVYFKDTSNGLTDTEMDTFWNIFVAPGELAAKGSFFRDTTNSRLYRVRGDYLPTEGLRVCQSDELDTDARLSVVFDSGAWNPVTEVRSAGTTTVNGIWLELPKFYRFRHRAESMIQPGDRALFIANTYTPKVGDKFTMESLKWIVVSIQAEVDAWALHVRLV